jgi:amidase
MKEKQLDAIIGVSTGPAALTDLLNGDYGNGFYFCQPAAMAGFPHVTVPMGFVEDMPVGLSFMSGAWHDGPLLGMAFAYEQVTKHRKAPRFIA